jgi:hypothetical protein
VPLTTDWGEASLPLSSLRQCAHWAGNPPNPGGAADRIRAPDVAVVSVCFGGWLYPAHAADPRSVEIEAIEVE